MDLGPHQPSLAGKQKSILLAPRPHFIRIEHGSRAFRRFKSALHFWSAVTRHSFPSAIELEPFGYTDGLLNAVEYYEKRHPKKGASGELLFSTCNHATNEYGRRRLPKFFCFVRDPRCVCARSAI